MNKKTLVITGSSDGIGYHLAKTFLEMGHQVVINGRNETKLKDRFNSLKKISPQIAISVGDVNDSSTFDLLIKTAVHNFEKIDYWINNAGIPQPYLPVNELEENTISGLLKTNLDSLIIGSKKAVNFFLEQGYGILFNMEGLGSDGRMLNKLTIYGTSKRAVNYFTKALSKELAKTCVRVGAINPGMVKTKFLEIDRNFEDEKEKKQYDKVMRILAEDPEKVTKFLAEKILKSKKQYNKISYLRGLKLVSKISRLILSR